MRQQRLLWERLKNLWRKKDKRSVPLGIKLVLIAKMHMSFLIDKIT